MYIGIYEKGTPMAPWEDEAFCIFPYLVLADKVQSISIISNCVLLSVSVDKWSDEMVSRAIPTHFHNKPEYHYIIEKNDYIYPIIKKIKKLKHKPPEAIRYIAIHKELMKHVRGIIKIGYEEELDKFGIRELLTFCKDHIWLVDWLNPTEMKNKEDYLIPIISSMIIDREAFFAFDPNIEKIFRSAPLDIEEFKELDFISIPLWNLPFFGHVTYEQMKYTRDNLDSILNPFKEELYELSDALFPIAFSSDNMQQIKQLCTEKIIPHQEPVQKAINESLYLSQLRNKYPSNLYFTFCLGITSAENLVSYYEKTKNIEPYVATQIKQQVSRHLKLNSAYIFTYFDMHVPIPVEN